MCRSSINRCDVCNHQLIRDARSMANDRVPIRYCSTVERHTWTEFADPGFEDCVKRFSANLHKQEIVMDTDGNRTVWCGNEPVDDGPTEFLGCNVVVGLPILTPAINGTRPRWVQYTVPDGKSEMRFLASVFSF